MLIRSKVGGFDPPGDVEKLLLAEDATVSLDLAELFHDAGKTYL
jgi:hypothetical protein